MNGIRDVSKFLTIVDFVLIFFKHQIDYIFKYIIVSIDFYTYFMFFNKNTKSKMNKYHKY